MVCGGGQSMATIQEVDRYSESGNQQYLTFRLAQEEYGIDILKIQEIRRYEAPTRIAYAPPFITGVMNLRGTIVPMVDLRIRFGCPSVECGPSTVVIILKLGYRIVGVVVDSVSDVIEIGADSFRVAPDMDSAIGSASVVGLGSVGERMLILLDVDVLMADAGMGLGPESNPA